MKTVVTLGEILVEILATEKGQSFLEPGPLIGPYPSGAPAIFIDQVARLGQPCGMIGCVGDDDFGRLNIERLKADGVDISAIGVHPTAATGSAFVTYEPSGDRHFVFNVAHSASGYLTLDDAAGRLLERADHVHVMGSSLFSPQLIEAATVAAQRVKDRGGTLSFDPNVRTELLGADDVAGAFALLLESCDLLLPSGPELLTVAGAKDEASALTSLASRGIETVVVKRGAKGASHHGPDGTIAVPAFSIEEVDPTGAGDCFGATFVVCWLRGMKVEDSLRYANASGARQATIRGPMEGTASFAELDDWMAARGDR